MRYLEEIILIEQLKRVDSNNILDDEMRHVLSGIKKRISSIQHVDAEVIQTMTLDIMTYIRDSDFVLDSLVQLTPYQIHVIISAIQSGWINLNSNADAALLSTRKDAEHFIRRAMWDRVDNVIYEHRSQLLRGLHNVPMTIAGEH